jgi:hypothetical protein
MVLFLFLSSAASQAFMVPSWSMTALASSLYDGLGKRIRCSYSYIVIPLQKSLAFFSSISMWSSPYSARF